MLTYWIRMVRAERFELPTFWFVARRSIQLSYARMRTKIDYQTGSKTPNYLSAMGSSCIQSYRWHALIGPDKSPSRWLVSRLKFIPRLPLPAPFQFHQIDRATGERIHYQNVAADGDEADDSGAERKRGGLHIASGQADHDEDKHVVEKSDIVKGYEYEKGKYAIIEPDDLKRLRIPGKDTLEIVQFSPASELTPSLYVKPYFVVPKKGPQATAFAVVRQAMVDTDMVGMGEIAFAGREHVVALAPPPDRKQPGMMLYVLRFAEELRDPG